jgi:CRISPR-associated protein (TIGR03984 family)
MCERVSLYTATNSAIGLVEALQSFEDRLVTGILYAPGACTFLHWQGGQLSSPEPRTPMLTEVFEARVFDAQGELRWQRDPSGGSQGRAVYLAESAPGFWEALPPLADLERYSNRYLLWGEYWSIQKMSDDSTWLCLATPRIGTLWTPPFEGSATAQRVSLETVEYLGRDAILAGAEHGNVVVVEERLVELAAYLCKLPNGPENPELINAAMGTPR